MLEAHGWLHASLPQKETEEYRRHASGFTDYGGLPRFSISAWQRRTQGLRRVRLLPAGRSLKL